MGRYIVFMMQIGAYLACFCCELAFLHIYTDTEEEKSFSNFVRTFYMNIEYISILGKLPVFCFHHAHEGLQVLICDFH